MHKDTCLHSMRTHAGEAWGYKKRWHEDIMSKEGTHIDMRTHAQARMFMFIQQKKWAWGHKIETWGNMIQSIRTRNMVNEDSRFTSWGQTQQFNCPRPHVFDLLTMRRVWKPCVRIPQLCVLMHIKHVSSWYKSWGAIFKSMRIHSLILEDGHTVAYVLVFFACVLMFKTIRRI